MVTAAVLTLLPMSPMAGTARIPLPKARPAAAPSARPPAPNGNEAKPKEEETDAGKDSAATAPEREPSACRRALTETIAIAPSIPDIRDQGGCGGEDLVRLEAVILPGNHRVAVKPAAILRCRMASAIADWVRNNVAPLTQNLGSLVTDLDNFDSFECRSRNRVAGAGLSEHGRANALDVRSFKLANGRTISLTDRTVPRDLREAVLHSVCARFSTVLGPGSDGYHEDHIHLDLTERHNDYRICQWMVWDPLPAVAPMLPEPRPADAPPRVVTDSPDEEKSDSGGTDDGARPAPVDQERPSTKKRR
jgi:hypothetical protein